MIRQKPSPADGRPTLEAGVDIAAPLTDLAVPDGIEMVRLSIEVPGASLGKVELPAVAGRVEAGLIADAVAAECAWTLLGRFFAANGLLPEADLDRLGWQLFLREVWGRPDWPEAWFYDPPQDAGPGELRRVTGRWTEVEVSAPISGLEAEKPRLDVALTAGGVGVGRVTVPAPIRAAELCARLTAAAGFELCRAVVREALIGAPLAGPPLRERLAAAARRDRGRQEADAGRASGIALAPGWRQALPAGSGWVIGRRSQGAMGGVGSRRAVLPPEAAEDAVAAAAHAGEPALELAGAGPGRVVYAPDLLWSSPAQASAPGPPEPDATAWGRHHFEALFARAADPWRYTSPYERTKYEQTLALIPPGAVGRGLEIGCAEGHFTERLCARVSRLLAADISEIALRRAAERCRGCGNVEYLRLDLARDPLPGRFGLIVCSETLYFLGGRDALAAAARRIVEALEPGGHLVMAHANAVADDPDRPGFDWDVPYGSRTIGEVFALTPGLRFVHELRTALYRVQLFRREEGFTTTSPEAETVREDRHSAPEPAVAEHILWHGGKPAPEPAARVVTDRLPILLYHRVAPGGSPATARYRVSPEAFEDQLRYLKDAGFRVVGLDEWAEAMAARRPLPGRAVAITFDDGYQDFLAWAWPALRRYGFSATMFLVAERIGGKNQWDAAYGEELALLTWPSIRRLRAEGLQIGSHGLTHRGLTALPNAQAAQTAARSKLVLETKLGTPVTAFAYPWGLSDGAVRHFVGACGYRVALDSKGGRSSLHGDPLNVPRIEVEGSDDLEAFVAKLSG